MCCNKITNKTYIYENSKIKVVVSNCFLKVLEDWQSVIRKLFLEKTDES